MESQTNNNLSVKRLVASKTVFIITIVVISLTVLTIWLFGLGQHRTIFENSLLSTSILSTASFLFLTIGLFRGIKLKDDLGRMTDKKKIFKVPHLADGANADDSIHVGDGIVGAILSIVFWLVMTILIGLLFWLIGVVVWTCVIVLVAILYWVFFRALRQVFKKSNRCRGNLTVSIAYGLAYTTLYNSWIYGVIVATHYFMK